MEVGFPAVRRRLVDVEAPSRPRWIWRRDHQAVLEGCWALPAAVPRRGVSSRQQRPGRKGSAGVSRGRTGRGSPKDSREGSRRVGRGCWSFGLLGRVVGAVQHTAVAGRKKVEVGASLFSMLSFRYWLSG